MSLFYALHVPDGFAVTDDDKSRCARCIASYVVHRGSSSVPSLIRHRHAQHDGTHHVLGALGEHRACLFNRFFERAGFRKHTEHRIYTVLEIKLGTFTDRPGNCYHGQS